MLAPGLWPSPEQLHIMIHPLPTHAQFKVGGELVWGASRLMECLCPCPVCPHLFLLPFHKNLFAGWFMGRVQQLVITALSSPLLVTTRFMRIKMDGLRGYSFSSWVRCVINAGYYPFHNKISVHSCSFYCLCVLSRVKEGRRIKEKALQIKVWVSLCFLGIWRKWNLKYKKEVSSWIFVLLFLGV